MTVHRRQVIVGLGSGMGLGLAALAGLPLSLLPGRAFAQASVDALAEAGPLGDRALGQADAPVTIVEYASMTCSHCADFHENTLPALKERYIDQGLVRLVLREFPLPRVDPATGQADPATYDPLSAGAFMLARCSAGDEQLLTAQAAEPAAAPDERANDRYFAMIDLLFSQQRVWLAAQDPVAELLNIVRQTGFTEETFNACLSNQALLDAVLHVRNRGMTEFEVTSTPTFFVNGDVARGAQPIEEFERLMAPHLPS